MQVHGLVKKAMDLGPVNWHHPRLTPMSVLERSSPGLCPMQYLVLASSYLALWYAEEHVPYGILPSGMRRLGQRSGVGGERCLQVLVVYARRPMVDDWHIC